MVVCNEEMILNPWIIKLLKGKKDNLKVTKPKSIESEFSVTENQIENIHKHVFGSQVTKLVTSDLPWEIPFLRHCKPPSFEIMLKSSFYAILCDNFIAQKSFFD